MRLEGAQAIAWAERTGEPLYVGDDPLNPTVITPKAARRNGNDCWAEAPDPAPLREIPPDELHSHALRGFHLMEQMWRTAAGWRAFRSRIGEPPEPVELLWDERIARGGVAWNGDYTWTLADDPMDAIIRVCITGEVISIPLGE